MATRIYVENFGPIIKGEITIKPLTILIGPNNTGKSYMSMIYYTFANAIKTSLLDPDIWITLETKQKHRLIDLLKKALEGDQFKQILREQMERIFVTKLNELIRYGCEKTIIRYYEKHSFLDLEFLVEINRKGEIKVLPKIKPLHGVESPQVKVHTFLQLGKTLALLMKERIIKDVTYLPASRSGVLQSYRSIAKALISLVSLAPIRETEIPGISGPAADFLAQLVSISPEKEYSEYTPRLKKVLENKLIEGEITIFREEGKPPLITYSINGAKIPLSRASSMIAEISPLILYLKYGVIGRGSTVIFEEPEAHQHPDKQALLATIIAYLINRLKLTFIITTHSDIFLNKISNLVSLSSLSNDELRRMKYSKKYVLKPEQVSVYSFKKVDEGSIVEKVPVSEDGISDEVFDKIIRNLYRETMDIYYIRQKYASRK